MRYSMTAMGGVTISMPETPIGSPTLEQRVQEAWIFAKANLSRWEWRRAPMKTVHNQCIEVMNFFHSPDRLEPSGWWAGYNGEGTIRLDDERVYAFWMEAMKIQGQHIAIRVVCEDIVVHFETLATPADIERWSLTNASIGAGWWRP